MEQERYGKRVILRELGTDKNGNYICEVQCDCGNINEILCTAIRRGEANQCLACRRYGKENRLKARLCRM